MPVKTVAVLKTFFETGDRPTESQFADLIDSFIHKQTGTVITAKSYNETTGEVSLSFSDSTSISFTIDPDLSGLQGQIDQINIDLDGKVDKIAGKGLSTEDFTTELKTKLENLVQVELPTSYEISFIVGLQAALDAKANDNEVVKSVNNVLPDVNGNVEINIEPEITNYVLSLIEAKLDYQYFGEDTFGIFLQVPAPEGNGDYIFAHNLDIALYVKMEQRAEAFLDVDADPSPITSIALTAPLAVDLFDKVQAAGGAITVEKNQITVKGYVIPTNYVYLEYVKNVPVTEGIGIDIIGTSAIGEGF